MAGLKLIGLGPHTTQSSVFDALGSVTDVRSSTGPTTTFTSLSASRGLALTEVVQDSSELGLLAASGQSSSHDASN